MITLAQRAHLVTLYTEPHRHYHNFDHVMHCLRELHDIRSLISAHEASTIEMAIWFHDAVYDPQAPPGCNEHSSAELLSANEAVPGVPLSTVYDLIIATVDHKIPEGTYETDRELFSYFLDIDLAILGRPEDEYNAYAKKIRNEYSFADDAAFSEGRRQVITSLLARDSIYFSAYFRSKYEEQACTNLYSEMTYLASI